MSTNQHDDYADGLPSDRPTPRLPSDAAGSSFLPSDRRPPLWADRLTSDMGRRIILPSDQMPPRRSRPR